MKKRMEGSGGDLADVVRAAAAAASSATGLPDWPFVQSTDMASFTPDLADRDFGDPFSFTGDQLILQNADPDPSGFFYDSDVFRDGNLDQETGRDEKEAGHGDQIVRKPTADIFSSLLEIPLHDPKLQPVKPPPAVGPVRVLKTPAFLSNKNNNNNEDDNMNSNSSRTLISMGGGDMQISSPQNTGNKRRKCQARKVVCIPAPAPANSRASGEVVPSDLWAWRKYGQKPIKGSPYPRGYYRCSSSKGCSARKQVERSRADPNMLVITYTSDHNHPWPTHRNALAGSTRSQPSKTTTTITKALPTHSGPQNETDSPAHHPKPNIKQETAGLRLESSNEFFEDDGVFLGLTVSEDSFFADLGEIESEPLDELFARGFHSGSKDFEPFGFYDWAADESNMTAAPAASGDDNNVGNS